MASDSDSTSSTSSISGSFKQENSFKCPGGMPKWVSSWKRVDIESVLHIYYEEFSCSIQDILDKNPRVKSVSSYMKQHMDILKNPRFLPELDFKSSKHDIYFHDYALTKISLQEAHTTAKTAFPLDETACSSLSPWYRSFIHVWICNYIKAIEDLVDTIFKKRKAEDGYYKIPCEESYSRVVRAFATMCGLHVKNGDISTQSVWHNLRGMEKEVICRPDMRFYCTGEDYDTASNLLTVVEVKNKGKFSEEETFNRKRKRRAKRRYSNMPSSSSSSSEETQHLNPEVVKLPGAKESYIPWIEPDVGQETLGQHAGELLLDLHTYMEQHKGDPRASMLTMPGLIVDRNMIYLTLLVMSNQHYEKLYGTEELSSEDRATIYYSAPHNMFSRDDRSVLIDTLVRLNNMEF